MNITSNQSQSSSYSNIAEIFLRTAEKYPDNQAIILPDRSWTYAELRHLISAAASTLKIHLESDPPRIAIIGNNHPSYIVAYLAARCLGLSTVEVGRHESLSTLLKIIKQTGVSYVLTDRDDLKAPLEDQLFVENFDPFITACEENSEPLSQFSYKTSSRAPSDEASIIYTSGTTGTPKGVILSHANFCFIVEAIVHYLNLTNNDRYALILPLCHTYGKTVLLTTCAVGGSVVLLENFQNLPNFLSLLSEKRCTLLSAVPYHANVLIKRGNIPNYDFSSLRAITFSGNKLPSATLKKIEELLPSIQIYSMYGLTESTTRACYVSPEYLSSKKDSCGKPLPGVELKISAEDGSTLPPGKVGEIFLRGPNIMKGYFNDPELTAKTLIDGWLRTGDLGYLDEDGHLYLEGRMKDIIKCAGERISPVEIEEALMQHPEVSEVAVTGTPDPMLGEIVHAFIVPDGSVEESELRAFCVKKLSHHKIPRRYTFVKNIPKSATGKTQKHLLKENEDGK